MSGKDLIRKYEQEINDALGENLLVPLSKTAPPSLDLKEGLSIGSCNINNALSGSPLVGFAWGRIVEIYGPEQSGKTTLALHAIRECQRLGLPAMFVDAEHALDVLYATNIGVDIDQLSLCQPEYGEQALSVVEAGVSAGYRLIVVDSVPALVPKVELQGEIGDAHMGVHARMMGQALRKLTGKCCKARTIIIFLNQIRMKIGMVFGNPESTPGGKALKFFSSYRLEVRAPRGGARKEKSLSTEESVEMGIGVKVKIVKNKLYPPYRVANICVRYGRGIDRCNDIVGYLKKVSFFGPPRPRVCGVAVTPKKLESMLATNGKARKEVLSFLKAGIQKKRD